MIWPAVIVGSLGAYVLKLSGYVIPERVLDNPRRYCRSPCWRRWSVCRRFLLATPCRSMPVSPDWQPPSLR
jgi:hypothetical protein